MSAPRVRIWRGLLSLGFAAVVFAAASSEVRAQALAGEHSALVEAVSEMVLPVSDLDRSVEFFTGVLGFERGKSVEVAGEAYERLEGVFGVRMQVAWLTLGDESLELVQYLAPEGRPVPADSRSNDRWFQHIAIVVSDMDAAYARLRRFKVRHASSGPQRLPDWNKDAGGISAFYFKDPDGHSLEVIAFPPGKGDEKWREPRFAGRLFLGIDHTAIVVGDTDTSLRFYRDTLGMRVAGTAENYGAEQEHLNNVAGARLRITALRAARGPGVELLEYLAPSDGRSTPVEVRSNDLIAWQVRFVSRDPVAASAALRGARARLVSPGLVQTPDELLGFGSGIVARDPDGHELQIVGCSR